MKTTRRDFLTYGSAFALVNSVPSFAFAQGKPLFESINMFIPAAPGGGWDGTSLPPNLSRFGNALLVCYDKVC